MTVTDRYQPSQEREFVQAASNSTNIKGWSSPEDEVTEGQYHGTDLELLKRCLYLANENNILKREIDRGMIENEELRKQVAHLATELAKLSEERTRETAEMEAKLKYRSEERGNDLLKVD